MAPVQSTENPKCEQTKSALKERHLSDELQNWPERPVTDTEQALSHLKGSFLQRMKTLTDAWLSTVPSCLKGA